MSDPSGLWEQQAGWWQAGFTDGVDAEYTEQIIPIALAELAEMGGATRVLDVGCGEGQITRLAGESVAVAIGVDPTWAQVTEAVRRGGPASVSYCRGGAAALPFVDSSF